jgi:hypothetical protein
MKHKESKHVGCSGALIVKMLYYDIVYFLELFSNFDRMKLTLKSLATQLQVRMAVKANFTVWRYTAEYVCISKLSSNI